ncbi:MULTISPECIES: TIR domain-containing protein [unclassified Bradyrhizobium]|uniref:TIR domain-containing protein n=1 Tax=unclassified Bradyrhizobium TaxID=2631580 RepID=UPI001CD2E6D4|nr:MULTISPECIES: TIR domain-containing protein [unclassified Bradyrhizobium]MCA1378880.1 TIR domain-containing protein [Bradyrhizobium sp. IC4060]MCA1488984.1 TIR domain-containing protein [Bradyrhizobium sp. IC4061]
MGPVYVAFDGDKDKWAYAFMKGWKTNNRVDFDFEDAHDLDSMTSRAQNETYVKSALKQRMSKSDALIVIVGESTKHLYKFVRWEIELAIALGLPIIVANLNGKNTRDDTLCPPILKDVCAVHIPFKKNAISYALNNWPREWRSLDAQTKAAGYRYYDISWE